MHLGSVTEITEVLELVFDKDNVGCSIIIDIKGVSSYKKRMMSRSKATVTPHRVRHVQCSSMKIKIRFPAASSCSFKLYLTVPPKNKETVVRCRFGVGRRRQGLRFKGVEQYLLI